jgi:hypothetical protein
MRRQFVQDFRVRRQAVSQWLRLLQGNHVGYRGIAVSWDRVQELPEDDSVLDQVLTQDFSVVSQKSATNDRGTELYIDTPVVLAVPNFHPDYSKIESIRQMGW